MVEYQLQQPIPVAEADMADPMRILLYNVGYCTELDGSLKDYAFRWYRYLYTPRNVRKSAVHSLARMVEAHNPDVCCFVEIRKNLNRLPHFEAYASRDVDNKYAAHGFLRHMPFFRNNCNGFFSHKALPFKKHWMKHGTKKLLYEIDLGNDATLMFAHMSLRASTRRKQFEELKSWVKKKKRVILCGDFNTFKGEEDLEMFARDAGLNIVVPPEKGTFPTRKPRKAIDLFLCSPGIDIRSIQALQHVQASDHLPVLVEMKL
jgi:endonuclease/exonuclease/phosphatase family metal-dependent hydrolase